MKYGDLSNATSPKIYVVADESVFKVGEDNEEFYELIEEGKCSEAVNIMLVDTTILNKISWLSIRKGINIFIVTWMGHGMAEAIENWFNDLSIPVRGCLSITPVQLGKMTAQDETTIGIYDPEPGHMLMYGSKGHILRNEKDLL